jgi:hypothetical protein
MLHWDKSAEECSGGLGSDVSNATYAHIDGFCRKVISLESCPPIATWPGFGVRIDESGTRQCVEDPMVCPLSGFTGFYTGTIAPPSVVLGFTAMAATVSLVVMCCVLRLRRQSD